MLLFVVARLSKGGTLNPGVVEEAANARRVLLEMELEEARFSEMRSMIATFFLRRANGSLFSLFLSLREPKPSSPSISNSSSVSEPESTCETTEFGSSIRLDSDSLISDRFDGFLAGFVRRRWGGALLSASATYQIASALVAP